MNKYFHNIRDFALKNSLTPWQLDRLDVATTLLRICDNPDIIYQNKFGICGEVSFLRAWLYRDPISVVDFATKLFENGNSNIGSYHVQAADVLLNNKYMKEHQHNKITSAVWMICGALVDTEDDVMPYFDGNPSSGLSTVTWPWELVSWLEATKLYKWVDCDWSTTTNSKTIDDLIKELEPYRPINGNQYTQMDVFLLINSNMFFFLISSEPPFERKMQAWYPIIPNHWIMLEEPVEDLGNGQVRLSVWTLGETYKMTLTKDLFNSNYSGYIKAHAYGSRREITPRPSDNFHIVMDAWYSPEWTLEIDWQAFDDNKEWSIEGFNIASTTDGPLPLKYWFTTIKNGPLPERIWYDGSNDRNHVSVLDPDLIGPNTQSFYVNAFNFWSNDPENLNPISAPSNIVIPDCRTETQHFRFSSFGYLSPHQIRDWDSHKDIEVKSTVGCLLGRKYSSHGVMGIMGNDKTIHYIPLDSDTPDFVAAIAISLEYCYYWLTGSPFSFGNYGIGEIEVSIRNEANSATIDPYSGCGKMIFNSNLEYEDIPLLALNMFLDLIWKTLSPINLRGPEWDIPPRYVIQDTLLGLNKYFPLVQSFVRHPEDGLKDEEGTAAFWAYRGLRFGDPEGIIRSIREGTSHLVSDPFANFIYSDKQKDVYNDDTDFGNFVLATASLLLVQAPTDSRFNFGFFQDILPKPPATSYKLSLRSPIIFRGSLSNRLSMAFHILNLDSGIANVAISLQRDVNSTSDKSLLQIMLLGANDVIIDVIKTDKSLYDRTIGLRGNIVRKILIAVANREDYFNSSSFKYTVKATAITSACDVMITRWNRPEGRELVSTDLDWDTPDIWLTSDDPKIPIDTIDAQNDKDLSVVHVRLHNFGNKDAQQVRVNLYYQNGYFSPLDDNWQAMQLDGLQNGLIMNVPANGTSEATARWFCPIRFGFVSETISIAAELESTEDLSPDNNRATKNHAWTNKIILGSKPPAVHINYKPTEDKRLWVVGVQIDGENILERGGKLAQNVTVKQTVNEAQPNVTVTSLYFQVDTDQIVALRTTPARLWKSTKFPVGWNKKFVLKDNALPVTFLVSDDQNHNQGFTVLLPATQKTTATQSSERGKSDQARESDISLTTM